MVQLYGNTGDVFLVARPATGAPAPGISNEVGLHSAAAAFAVGSDTVSQGANATITTEEDVARIRTTADFGFSGPEGHAFAGVYITTVPNRGALALNGDRIDLSLIDATSDTAANDTSTFVGAAAFRQTAGELRTLKMGAQWFGEGDVNGDGMADFVLALVAATALAPSDFIF